MDGGRNTAVAGEQPGEYLLTLPENVDSSASVSAEGYFPLVVQVDTSMEGPQEVFLSPSATLTLEVRAMEVVEEAMGGLQAVAWRSDSPSPGLIGGPAFDELPVADLREDGKLVFSGLEPGAFYDIAVAGGGFTATSEYWAIPAEGQIVPIRLAKLAGMELVPVDAAGDKLTWPADVVMSRPGNSWTYVRGIDGIPPTSARARFAYWQHVSLGGDSVEPRHTLLCEVDLDRQPPPVPYQLVVPGFPLVSGEVVPASTRTGIPKERVVVKGPREATGGIRISIATAIGAARAARIDGGEASLALTRELPTQDGHPLSVVLRGVDLNGDPQVFHGIPEGRYEAELVLRSVGQGAASAKQLHLIQTVQVTDGQVTDLGFDLSSHGQIVVQLDENGKAYQGKVWLRLKSSQSPQGRGLVWAQGPYVISGLPPGEYSVSFDRGFRGAASGVSFQSVAVTVAPGGTHEVHLSLPPWSR